MISSTDKLKERLATDTDTNVETNAVTASASSDGVAKAKDGKSARRIVYRLQAVAFILGLALLIYVINRVGVQSIFDALKSIGFGFFVLLSINGLRHIFRTGALVFAIPPEHRNFKFRQALGARLGGEAISFLTFTGPVLGEATKAAMLRKRMPIEHGVQAVVIDSLLYNLSVSLFILSGAVVMFVAYPLPRPVQWTLLLIASGASFALAAVAVAVRRRVMPVTWAIDRLTRLTLLTSRLAFLTGKREKVTVVEANVYDFYRTRPRSFLGMCSMNFLAHASSVLEVYVALKMLGLDARVSAAYVIESLTKVINAVFGFVPGTIGVYEGGTEVILQTLGYAAATGVTLALVRKAGIIFWTGVGLLILMRRAVTHTTQRVLDRYPRLEKAMDNLVFSNISHRPARTFVSILGVAVGVFLIIFTTGLAHGVLRERGRREANINAEIIVSASGTLGLTGSNALKIPVARAAEIERVEGVRAAVPLGQNTLDSDKGFGSRLVDGIEFNDYARLTGLRIIEGKQFTDSGDEAIIDTVWKQDRKASVGDTVQLYERPFKIVGVYEPPGGGRIKIPLRTMQDQLGAEGRATRILVSCADPAQQDQVAARLHARFPEDQIIFTRDLPDLYSAGVPALNVFINVITTIAAIISVLVILLAMYTTVTERTRQIGILKSLGMSNSRIAWTVEQEAILVSVLGVAGGVLLALVARFALMRTSSLSIDIEPRSVLIALLIGLIGGTIGALYPALRAARQDAVDALSYE